MSGGPPHLDLFDYKPELVKWNDKPCPDEFLKGRRFAFTSGVPKLMGTPHTFAQYGKNGIWMSDAIPNFHDVADELCVIKSLNTDQFNHTPAELLLFTGSARQGRPSMGSWVTYGLGSENENLPGFVALISSGVQPSGGAGVLGGGVFSSAFFGVLWRAESDLGVFVYGTWDFHGTKEVEDIGGGLTKKCSGMDKPVAALIRDLRQRGLLDDTLIVWGGEFGRTPFREGRTASSKILGRDHYPDCFTVFLAGGGIKHGISYGETDELGFSVSLDKVHIHDLQATILHLLC